MGAQGPKIKRRMLNRLSQPGAENRYPITNYHFTICQSLTSFNHKTILSSVFTFKFRPTKLPTEGRQPM